MKMNLQSLSDRAAWDTAGVTLPAFDIQAMREETKVYPVWVHFGAGNIFRGFIARLQQQLLNSGLAEALRADTENAPQMQRLCEIFEMPTLQMVSFTITEKGYALTDMKGGLLPAARMDMENGPAAARHAMGVLTALLLRRFQKGAHPLALVSMDNCSHNGEKLQSAVLEMAHAWCDRGYVDNAFLTYLQDENKVTFPWSMIDKITPRPSEEVREKLEADGLEEMAPVVTERNTYIAPYVNAEVPQYLVVEDSFPNGRPPLQEAGVYFADRNTVNNAERMKVTTCLNPLHTALAVFGCLLGYTSIAAEMQDPQLKSLVETIGYKEGLPVVVDPKIFSPRAFLDEVIESRLPNPFIPDMPQRIATDTSQKMPIRFGETIKAYQKRPDLDPSALIGIPLALAGWCRYLLGVNDELAPMEVSSDPMKEELQQMLRGVTAGMPERYQGQLRPILSSPVLFGTDLYEVGLGEKVEGLFLELIAGKGAVRNTLQKYLACSPQ